MSSTPQPIILTVPNQSNLQGGVPNAIPLKFMPNSQGVNPMNVATPMSEIRVQ